MSRSKKHIIKKDKKIQEGQKQEKKDSVPIVITQWIDRYEFSQSQHPLNHDLFSLHNPNQQFIKTQAKKPQSINQQVNQYANQDQQLNKVSSNMLQNDVQNNQFLNRYHDFQVQQTHQILLNRQQQKYQNQKCEQNNKVIPKQNGYCNCKIRCLKTKNCGCFYRQYCTDQCGCSCPKKAVIRDYQLQADRYLNLQDSDDSSSLQSPQFQPYVFNGQNIQQIQKNKL